MITRLYLSLTIVLLLSGCLQKQNSYGIVGTPAISNDGKYIACIIAESEGLTHQENGGYRKTNYSSSYWLKQFETVTGKLIQKKKLIAQAELNNLSVTCYGGYDDKIWIYAKGLQAFDISTLEEKVNEEKIISSNSFPKQNFPYEERMMNVFIAEGYISFTATNGEKYRLGMKDLKIKSEKEITKNANNEIAERSISSLLHTDNYGTRCDTFNNHFFTFAKDSITAASSYVNNSDISETYYRMFLFTADYSIHRLGNHNSFDYSNIKKSSVTSYLNPCFLKDAVSNKVIHTNNPAGFLILHQDTVGSNAKTILTRIDINHNKIWESKTGISSKISNCIIKDKYCIISGNTDFMFSPPIGSDALCIVDMESGKITKPSLSQ